MKMTKKFLGINGMDAVVIKPKRSLRSLLASGKLQGIKLTGNLNRACLQAKVPLLMLILFLIIGFGFTSCGGDGDGGGGGGGSGGGSDKWVDLVGKWGWAEGEEYVNLNFNPDKSMGVGYVINYNSKIGGGLTTNSSIIFCSYDGTTLKVFDQNKKTKFTATVVKDGETLTISNYQHSSGDNYSYITKTYAKQP